jgi:hypothetical protein
MTRTDKDNATYAGFPLMSFTDPDWCAISVDSVKTAEVLIGGHAERTQGI